MIRGLYGLYNPAIPYPNIKARAATQPLRNTTVKTLSMREGIKFGRPRANFPRRKTDKTTALAKWVKEN